LYTQHKKITSFIPTALLLLLGLIFIALPVSYSQTPPNTNSFAQIIQDIDQRLGQGEKMAFRDLANIWSQRPEDKGFADMARRYLLVDAPAFDWSTDTLPQHLLSFYYDKADSLIYSHFLNVYYLQPIEQRRIKTKLVEQQPIQNALYYTRILKQNIEFALDKKKGDILQESLVKLAQVGTTTSIDLLRDIATDSRLKRIRPIEKRQAIISSVLNNLPDSTALKALFLLARDNQITFGYSRTKFAEITNHYSAAIDLKELKQEEETLQKEFKRDFTAIRQAGYQESLRSQALFFEAEADYYAWILATTQDDLFWIKENALVDMLATKQPQVLFYLAGLQFRQWRLGKNDHKYLNLLNSLADMRLQVADGNGNMVAEFEEETAQLNFLTYWTQHYKDYEWEDSAPGYFTNILHKSEIIDSYEKYFRRLNSPNDSAALEAFLILTEGVPKEVNRLMKKYRSLLRSYNSTLPPLKFNIIENISRLTDFCKKNGYTYKPTAAIEAQLKDLGKSLNPKDRLQIENQLINNLKLEELTGIEYWASIHAQNIELNYSVGRIIDRLYTKYWERIIYDEEQFRFFLLKSAVFRKLTTFGIARLYHKKVVQKEIQVKERLHEIALIERNEVIKEAIEFWQKGETEYIQGISVQELLVDPESFNSENINKLPKFSQKELAAFFFTLKGVRNRKALKKMERYLSTYASIDIVPELFSTPKEHWESNASAAKVIVKILESIYGYSFSKNPEESLVEWYALWESKETSYAEWGKRLFLMQIEELKTQDKIRIGDINSVSRSSEYLPEHRAVCLEALRKIEKTRSISQLSIQPLISVDKELHYLANIPFSHRNLDNLSKILAIDNPIKLLNYMLVQMQAYTVDERGFLLNDLLRQDWLFQLINKKNFSNHIKQILSSYLENYLNESEYLTEFEEQATQLNLLLLRHNEHDLREKLMVLSDANLEYKVKEKWLDIIFADIKYEEIKYVFPNLTGLESFEDKEIFKFIYKDFGLPIFDLDKKGQMALLEKRLKTMSQRKVYEKYLVEFGIDFKQRNGKLDFQKMYDILKYDLVIPFVGEGGQYRDYHVYAIIKLLELRFKTSLDFSDKLNDYQTFFQFNSFARVKAWKEFLLEHRHVKGKSNTVPSFNEDF